MNLSLAAISLYLITMLTLIIPLLNPHAHHFHFIVKTAIKTAFLLSLTPMLLMVSNNLTSSSITWKWFSIYSSSLSFSVQLDFYSILFIPIALMVSWSIIEFSTWYMTSDIKIELFFKYLLIFLLAMMLLVVSDNIMTLFIGWEGVGIMSFLLIGWYFSRSNAGTAAMQAIAYNRVGDIGLLFAIFWLFSMYDSTDLTFTSAMPPSTCLLLALMIAAASKSAQFSFHPWLASAMEGPTPVSALLHSSTMVVAGVFLLIRIQPIMKDNQTILTLCLCLGAISTAFAATCALTQNDIKKIIAYSTSSQLGLMMVSIGLNLPHLAFFHICTHAFFKAMLFLCSGSIIHNLSDEQDIRKMGGLHLTMPITTSCVTIGSLALMGTPFLAGFFSKDAIIESMTSSALNSWAMIMTMIATSLTAVYSIRIIYFASTQSPRFNSLILFNENSTPLVNSMLRLAIGSMLAGFLMSQIMLPDSPMVMSAPTHLKISALLASILGLMIAADLASTAWADFPTRYNLTKIVNTSFYPNWIHRILPSVTLNFSLKTSTHLIDTLWLEKIGPKGIVDLHLPPILKSQEMQKGLIKTYLSTFSLTTLLTILFLQLV